MNTAKRLAATLLISTALIAGNAASAVASQSPQFDMAEDEVTLDAIAVGDFPIRDTATGIDYADLSYLYAGDLVTVSPPQGENIELDGGYIAIRGVDGTEGVIPPDFVVLLPKGAQTFESEVEVIEAKASGGFIGGIGTVDVHEIHVAPSNDSDVIREAAVGETLTAANDMVIGPGRMFTEVGYRPVELEGGQTGYILAQIAQPVTNGAGDAETAKSEVAPVIPPKMTESLHIGEGVELYAEPDSKAPTRENSVAADVEGTQSFSADGARWHQVTINGGEFFVKAADVTPGTVAATPEPTETAGVKDKIGTWWNGSENEAAEKAPVEEEPGFWAGMKEKVSGTSDTTSTLMSLPSLIISAVLALLSGVLGLGSRALAVMSLIGPKYRIGAKMATVASAISAVGAAVMFPDVAPNWAGFVLLCVGGVGALTAFSSVGRGASGRVNLNTIAIIAGSAAAAFIAATLAGRPTFAAGALAIIMLGAAAGIAPRLTGRKDMTATKAPAEDAAPVDAEERTAWRLDLPTEPEETEVERTSELEPIREPVLQNSGAPAARIKLTLDEEF